MFIFTRNQIKNNFDAIDGTAFPTNILRLTYLGLWNTFRLTTHQNHPCPAPSDVYMQQTQLIMRTNLFKYTENFTTPQKKWKFSDEKF